MAHSLILGMTESGKTTLAQRLARAYRAQGIGVIVLDPLLDSRWQADFISADQGEFLRVFWRSKSCMAFLDEGAESVGRYDLAMKKTATRGRHLGHACHFITHRASDLAPVVRDQCRHLFLFTSSRRDGELLAHEFNQPDLELCGELRQGEYFHASRYGEFERGALFTQTDRHTDGGTDNGATSRDSGCVGDGVRTAGGRAAGKENGTGAASPEGGEGNAP